MEEDEGLCNKGKKTREEVNKYWTRFQTVGFAVLLSGDFHSRLIIPRRFTDNLRRKLPEKVTLRGPSVLSDKWEAQLSTIDNVTSLVGEGWKEFVVSYSLKEKDILVFKYKNFYFKVSVFDGRSCWVENESSYFVKKSAAPSIDGSEGRKEKQSESSLPGFRGSDTSYKQGRIEYQENQRNGYNREKISVAEDSEELSKEDGLESRPAKRSREEERDIRAPLQIVYDKSRVQLKNVKRSRGTKLLTQPSNNKKARRGARYTTRSPYDTIRKRKPTTEETEWAKQQASRELTEESFLMVMSCSHVYKLFRLAPPKKWTTKYMSGCHQDVCLRVSSQENKEWHIKYSFDKNKGSGMFSGGWVRFVRDNALHESDVCVFKLAGRKEGKICLDVKIIRAIEEEGDQSNDGNCSMPA